LTDYAFNGVAAMHGRSGVAQKGDFGTVGQSLQLRKPRALGCQRIEDDVEMARVMV
jgi:hypothetical protein